MNRSSGRPFWLLASGCVLLFFLNCAAPGGLKGPCTIAVWDLEDFSARKNTLADIGPLLSARIVETVQSAGQCSVVERQKLLLVMEELHLGSSELADTSTKLRVGRIAGARQMVFGAYQVVGETMRLDLRLVDVASGEIMATATRDVVSSQVSQWISAAGAAAGELLR